MRTDLFDYSLPMERIAQRPLAKRDGARMMVLDRKTGGIEHAHVRDLDRYLGKNDLLVLNKTRVMPARLFARKSTGARVEIFLLRPLPGVRKNLWEALVSPAKRIKGPTRLALPERGSADVEESLGEGHFRIAFKGTGPFRRFLDETGHVPLPPYIKRPDEKEDRARYQTVFAKKDGSVAAPTAGLHFTTGMLEGLKNHGKRTAEVVLHVGLGTFLPVDAREIEDHVMHSEWIEVPASTVKAVERVRTAGGRVVAAGTTVCRALEAASAGGRMKALKSETRLFLTPGCVFRTVDVLFTNFHQPRSTLLMLVSAFAGRERVLGSYREAIREKYRFFSYGDAMLIL